MEDSFRHKGMRREMVREVQEMGIRSKRVLKALDTVPRHLFLDSAFTAHAYQNKPFPIGFDQTISQPYTVARQTELLGISPGDKVLEIGTGSGYQCAVLCVLGANVFSVERLQPLHLRAKKLLADLGVSPRLFLADGTLGLKMYAPYDKIIVTAAAPYLPKSLIEQLKDGGKLIVPVGSEESQKMLLIEKKKEGQVLISEHGDFCFVKLTGEKGWKE